MLIKNENTYCHLVKGRLLLGGLVALGGQGRMRGDHAQASGDVLSVCMNGMDWRLSDDLGLHWLLLKVLEHLLKLKVPVRERERQQLLVKV